MKYKTGDMIIYRDFILRKTDNGWIFRPANSPIYENRAPTLAGAKSTIRAICAFYRG
jgi:hypothetical protein